jgi:uncharacterized protein YjbI with pentapeptide repeats
MRAEIKKRVIRKKKFIEQDFSSKEIINTVWRQCSFVNCRFDKTGFKNNIFINCRFADLAFTQCQFIDTQLANNNGKHSGIFENVRFENCRFVRVDFNFPIIRGCSFINNSYSETDFDGSRFYDSRFEGEMDSVEFRGYSVLAKTHALGGLINRVNPKKYRNPMENVDFTRASLKYVGFSNSINLANCRFTIDENSFLIRSPRACFTKVKAIIEHSWSPNDKKRALHLIDTFLFTKAHESMPLFFFYKRPVADSLKEFDAKLFALVRQVNDETVS